MANEATADHPHDDHKAEKRRAHRATRKQSAPAAAIAHAPTVRWVSEFIPSLLHWIHHDATPREVVARWTLLAASAVTVIAAIVAFAVTD